MSRRGMIVVLALFCLVAGSAAAFLLLPKHYRLGERLTGSMVFWHDDEAFIFLSVNETGQATNLIQDKLNHSRSSLLLLLSIGSRAYQMQARAYRLSPNGQLTSEPLPFPTGYSSGWTLHDGNIQFRTSDLGTVTPDLARWDGTKFVAVTDQPAAAARRAAQSGDTLTPDDASDDDTDSGVIGASARAAFKAAGWHWKQLGYNETKDPRAVLPIKLGDSSFDLTVTSFPRPSAEQFATLDSLDLGMQSLTISTTGQPESAQTIWEQNGWQTISRADFEQRQRQARLGASLPSSIWVSLVVLALIYLWRFGAWAKLFVNLFTTKSRVLTNLGTSYSFPPATAMQFPLLDIASLDRYTREFESMGFERLSDISLVSNAPKPIPNFCRVFVHKQNHCFAGVMQMFPIGKAPAALKCTIQSVLDDDWSLAFSDRKPQASGPMIRRKRAMQVGMPNATPYELLNSFLQMRSQVCQDLSISVVKNDTMEAYMANAQKTVSDIREAVKQKNMTAVLPQFYWRKFSLLKTKPEYVWLGDYPKISEGRKHGLVMQARPL